MSTRARAIDSSADKRYVKLAIVELCMCELCICEERCDILMYSMVQRIDASDVYEVGKRRTDYWPM
jgi:hypothetical protein